MNIKDAASDLYIVRGTYNIGFNEDDETQFDAGNYDDLRELWEEFCKENNFDLDCIDYIEQVNTYGKKLLEITLVLTSDNTFDVEVYEPESRGFNRISCQDNGIGDAAVMEEIRSWVSLMRDNI